MATVVERVALVDHWGRRRRRAGHDDVGNAQVDSDVPSHIGSGHGRAAASVSSSTGGQAEARRRFDLGQPDMDGRSADTSNPPRPDVPNNPPSPDTTQAGLGEVRLNTDPGRVSEAPEAPWCHTYDVVPAGHRRSWGDRPPTPP